MSSINVEVILSETRSSKMSSSAVCLVFLLCSLAATFDSGESGTPPPSPAPSLTYTSCGSGNMCRNQPNVDCQGGSCKCLPGYIGNGNIACVDPGDSCLCTMARDPHVVSNIGRRFRLPIPCAHTIAEFTTPMVGGTGICTVNISGLAYNPKSNSSLNFYERQVDIRVSLASLYVVARIISGQDAFTQVYWPGNVVSSTNGNTLITIPECDLQIAYRSDGSFFSLRTSRDASGDGICDNCQQYGQVPPVHGGVLDDLYHQLSHLSPNSPVDGEMIDRNGFCVDIHNAYNSCPSSRRYNAVQYCGGFLVDRRFTPCVQQLLGTTIVSVAMRASLFNECMSAACDANRRCSELRAFYVEGVCPTDRLSILSTDGFCVSFSSTTPRSSTTQATSTPFFFPEPPPLVSIVPPGQPGQLGPI